MEEKKLKISFEKADYLINKLQDILADYLHGGESDEVIAKFEELLDIEEKAYEIWDKEGRVLLSINLCLKSARKDIEGYDEYRFYNYCYLSERGEFIIPSELKERLKKIIEGNTLQLMEESFGEHLSTLNNIIRLERQYERLIKRYKVMTLTGWLLAVLIVIMLAIL